MRIYGLLKILIVVALTLAFVRVVVSNTLSTSGVELGKINEEINIYKTQNDIIREKLFTASSFSNIASRAAKLGFLDGKEKFVLTSPLPIAQR